MKSKAIHLQFHTKSSLRFWGPVRAPKRRRYVINHKKIKKRNKGLKNTIRIDSKKHYLFGRVILYN